MNAKLIGFIFFLSFCLLSCQNTGDQTKDATPLTYQQMWKAVFSDTDGEQIEWHGEAMDQSAVGELSLLETGSCGGSECGKTIMLASNSDRATEVIIQSVFSIPDLPEYTAVKFTVPSGQQLTVGCSHLCMNGTKVVFSPKIVGAKYLD